MRTMNRLMILSLILLCPLTARAGLINWIYGGYGYMGTVYNYTFGTGQLFPIGKFAIYSAENVNMIYNTGSGTPSGIGVSANLDIAYKLVGKNYAKKGFEMEIFLGGFAELDLSASSQLAYGPELGMNFQFWITPGFGFNVQAKSGFNISGLGDTLFPSTGIAMMWRPYDKNKIAFSQQKKKVKTSPLNAGVYQKDGNVMFVYESPRTDITSMTIFGDFNNWNEDSIVMEEDGGVWKVVLKLDPGIYQYKYKINGKEKIIDPKSEGYTPDGSGGKNSILEVEE